MDRVGLQCLSCVAMFLDEAPSEHGNSRRLRMSGFRIYCTHTLRFQRNFKGEPPAKLLHLNPACVCVKQLIVAQLAIQL